MPYHAVGSSYLLNQTAGGEMMGGLTVTIYPRYDSQGEWRVVLTNYFENQTIDDPNDFQSFLESAEDGVRSMAQQLDIDLIQFDVKLDRFLYHPVDCHPRVFYQAGRSALRSAYEALEVRDVC